MYIYNFGHISVHVKLCKTISPCVKEDECKCFFFKNTCTYTILHTIAYAILCLLLLLLNNNYGSGIGSTKKKKKKGTKGKMVSMRKEKGDR
jgi:hypothetical protein